jgi:hypothetical protein
MTTVEKPPESVPAEKKRLNMDDDEVMNVIETELNRLEEEADDPQVPPMLNRQMMEIWFTGYIARVSQQLERLENYNLKYDISQFNVVLADIRRDLSHLSYEFSGVKVMISNLQDDLALQQGWVKNFDMCFGNPIKKIVKEMLVKNAETIFSEPLKEIVSKTMKEVMGVLKNDR